MTFRNFPVDEPELNDVDSALLILYCSFLQKHHHLEVLIYAGVIIQIVIWKHGRVIAEMSVRRGERTK
jgi:hypothetical protein